jgi:hypothetical protein
MSPNVHLEIDERPTPLSTRKSIEDNEKVVSCGEIKTAASNGVGNLSTPELADAPARPPMSAWEG